MQSFFGISVLISLWAGANYLTEAATGLERNELFNRLAFLFGFLAIANTAVFSSYFTKRTLPTRKKAVTLWVMTIIIAGISATDYVAGTVHQGKEGLEFTLGSLIWVYLLAVSYCVFIIVRNFYAVIRHGALQQRSQAKIMAAALTISITIGVSTNIIIPALSSSFHSTKLGPPLLSLFLITTVGYAIIRHQLFDIRRALARTLTYVLLISTMTVIYAVAVFGIASHLAPSDSIFATQAAPIITAILLSLSVSYLKFNFDKLTNRFFYRDAYDPQVFLDELNKTLVSNIELGILLRRSAAVIQKNLKAESCFITVRQTDERPFRLLGTDAPKFNADQLQYAYEEMRRMEQKLLISDDIKSEHTKLKRTLNSGGIALVSAPTGYEQGGSALAYLVLGPKKSGNIYSKDDLRLIQIITDELVIAIQNALRFEEIQGFNATLQEKINQATEQLQRNNKKLQVLDQTKDEFISMASHQLRTPLTSIKGYLSMVLDGDAGSISDDQRKMLQQAFISSQRMTYLISDLLNVSRLKTGKFFIEQIPVDLSEVVRQEVDQLVEAAKIRELTLEYNQPGDFPVIQIDETKTRQVIMNFIDNAIYYTPAGGKITVKLHEKPKTIELSVTDTGIGVPKNEQHRLFSKFYRAPNAKRARPDGTGLGLFMAKKIIVAQGGSLVFHSKTGQGSTFGFTLPKTPKSNASRG